MAQKDFSVDINLNKNYLLNAGIQPLAAPPTTPVIGQIYWDTALNQLRNWTGTAWVDNTNVALSTLITATTPIAVAPNGNGVIISIGAASASSAGSMSIANFNKLLAATSLSTANTLAQRDAFGRLQVATPVAAADAANKQYVDDLISGKDWKESVRVASIGNLALSGIQTVDGITLVAGDRILCKNQTTGSQNGIYVVAAGAWTRALDADVSAEVTTGMTTLVEQGTVNASTGWSCNTPMPITLNTTALSFIKTLQSAVIIAGAGLTQTGNTFDVVAADGSVQVNADSVQVRLVANGGIGVNASGLFVQNYTPVATTTVARVWASPATNVGGGTAVTFTHNLNNINTLVMVRDATSNRDFEYDITHTSVNAITVTANGATQSVIVTVIG
jgi:hypothetical protein